MAPIDDLELEPRGPQRPDRREERRWRALLGLLGAVLLVALVAVFFVLWKGTEEAEEAEATRAAARAAEEEPAPALPAERLPAVEPEELPSLGDSDEAVRGIADRVLAAPAITEWLSGEELIRRATGAIVAIARGESPRPFLAFLEPETPFRAAPGPSSRIDPESYHRFDAVGDVVGSVDPARVAQLYRKLQPLFEDAYRELGYPRGSFDTELARAIDRLLQVPVVDDPPLVEEKVRSWGFVDPGLEALAPAEKALLRMGPRNQRIVQKALREIARELHIEVGQRGR